MNSPSNALKGQRTRVMIVDDREPGPTSRQCAYFFVMEYTATTFAELYRTGKELTIDFHPESKYFVQSIAGKGEIRPWLEEMLYSPLICTVQWINR